MNDPKLIKLSVERGAWSGLLRPASGPRPRADEAGRNHGLRSSASKSTPMILSANGMTDAGQELDGKSEGDRVSELAVAGCSNSDIALLVGCCQTNLLKRHKKLIAKARAQRRKQILENQNAAAAKGNATILIWLGKVELEQVDKKPRPEPVNVFLDAMDAASEKHDHSNPSTPGPLEK
jgi:hypothetical protein